MISEQGLPETTALLICILRYLKMFQLEVPINIVTK